MARKKNEQYIVFSFKNFIENFDNEKEKPVVTKTSYRLMILFRFVQDPDI